jgi:hypothetical protein
MIRMDYTQLGIPNHTTYVGLKPTYINLHSDPPKGTGSSATREHCTPPIQPLAPRVHATLAISPLPMRGRPSVKGPFRPN